MGNLIKMDLYKVRKSKFFFISMLIMTALTIVVYVLLPILQRVVGEDPSDTKAYLSECIATPFMTSLMFLSVVHISYMDIANGYIKNIAGQLSNKGSTVISKFIAIGVHNLIFLVCASAVNTFASMISYDFVVDDNVIQGILTLLLKWLLSMAMSAILLFFTNGLKSNVLGYIVTICLCFNVLSALYMGINFALEKLGVKNFDISKYTIDTFYDSVNVMKDNYVVSSILGAIIYGGIFMFLTVWMFNKKDVK